MREQKPGVRVNIGRHVWENAAKTWMQEEGVWPRSQEIDALRRGETFHITLPLSLAEDLMDHCASKGWGEPWEDKELQVRYRRAAETIKFQLATQTGKNYGSLKRKHVVYRRLEGR